MQKKSRTHADMSDSSKPDATIDDAEKESFSIIKWAMAATGAVLVLVVAWVVAGIVAFVHSLMCIGKTPALWRGIMGVLVALMVGPFYWVYWYIDDEYCTGKLV
jgi:hypothetical protein